MLKYELAMGVMPSKYFGANAAWLRMAVIAYNVMTALKRLVLPADVLSARPKRLRFPIFKPADCCRSGRKRRVGVPYRRNLRLLSGGAVAGVRLGTANYPLGRRNAISGVNAFYRGEPRRQNSVPNLIERIGAADFVLYG